MSRDINYNGTFRNKTEFNCSDICALVFFCPGRNFSYNLAAEKGFAYPYHELIPKQISVLSILDFKYSVSWALWIHNRIKVVSLSSIMLILAIFLINLKGWKTCMAKMCKGRCFLFPLLTEYVIYSVDSRKKTKQVSAFKIQYIYIKKPSVNIACSYT